MQIDLQPRSFGRETDGSADGEEPVWKRVSERKQVTLRRATDEAAAAEIWWGWKPEKRRKADGKKVTKNVPEV